MKTDRSSSPATRVAAAVLAGFLLAAGQHAAGQSFRFRLKGPTINREDSSKQLAMALAGQVKEVQKRFGENRRALHTVQGPGGKPVYLRKDVSDLIARTGEDLGHAIEQVRASGMEPLLAWSDDELRRIQGGLGAAPVRTAASFQGRSPLPGRAPAAVFASLGRPAPPKPKSRPGPAPAPVQETVAAETSDALLDQVGAIVGRLFFLAERNDLEVRLWVGSAPVARATFRFWAAGKLDGATPAPAIIRTDGKRDRVLRGLYNYSAAWTKGPVTELIQYPSPAGASAVQLESERLNLVNGSSFFCCQFDEKYCGHVSNEKECRP
jgi:hypothetical protein